MAWSSSDRRQRLPVDWHKRRARAWRNAAGQCQAIVDGERCQWTGRLNGDGGQCDHRDRLGGDEQENLSWLCPPHHKLKTAAESQAARATNAASRPTERRVAEQHPGLIDTRATATLGGAPAHPQAGPHPYSISRRVIPEMHSRAVSL